MWCANCQSDVAAEVSADNQRIHCATCHNELRAAGRATSGTATRSAQEILARWSNSRLLDPFGPLPQTSATATAAANAPAATATAAPAREPRLEPAEVLQQVESEDGRRYRIEGAHQSASNRATNLEPVDRPESTEPSGKTVDPTESAQRLPPPQAARQTMVRQDEPVNGVTGPHWKFDVQHEIARSEHKSQTNWSAALSQLLAFTGVGVLTIGTACVIWGYFGGVASYLPLGWLTVTFGQMLLFLGLITHVSNGVETLQNEVETQFSQLHRRFSELMATRHDADRPAKHPQ